MRRALFWSHARAARPVRYVVRDLPDVVRVIRLRQLVAETSGVCVWAWLTRRRREWRVHGFANDMHSPGGTAG